MSYSIRDIIISLLPVIILNGILLLSWIVFAFIYPHREKTEEILKRMHPSFFGLFIREWSYWILKPFLLALKALRLTPNMITGISLLFGFASGYNYFKGNFATAGWLLVASGAFDMLDGMLARMTHRVTREGAFFDSSCDRFDEAAVFIGIAMYFALNKSIVLFGEYSWAYLLLITLVAMNASQIVSYVKARGESVGVTTTMGLMQRAERIGVLAFFSVFYPFFKLLLASWGFEEHIPLIFAVSVIAVFATETAITRMVILFNMIRNSHKGDV